MSARRRPHVAPPRRSRRAIPLRRATSKKDAAYVDTDSLDQALYAAERLEAGGVGINVNDVTELQAPFGGWKQSGFGRELGRAALEACLETKHVRIGLQTTVPSRPSGATAADQPLS